MITDGLFGGGKKFGHLFLVEPNLPVNGIQGNGGLAVKRVVDNYVALGGRHVFFKFESCIIPYLQQVLCKNKHFSPHPLAQSKFYLSLHLPS